MKKDCSEDEARCYVCNKKAKKTELLAIGQGIYRCGSHRWETVLRASRENLLARNKESI